MAPEDTFGGGTMSIGFAAVFALAFWPYPRSATAFIFSRVARMPSRLVRRRACPATLQ